MTATDQLGEGSIRSLFLKLALPAVVAQVVSLLYPELFTEVGFCQTNS